MLKRILANAVEWICLLLMVVLSIDLLLGVFSRYVLVKTFTWYDEIARGCFVWLTMLGAAVGVKRQAHFRLHIIVDRLTPRLRQATVILLPLVVIIFAGVLIQQGLVFLELGKFQQTPVMGLPKTWIYFAIPIGGALMILYSLGPLWRAFRDLAR
ncbi:MAG: Tripartite ATP-independent periplasmic transporter DctQ component [Deltaproteobacteria bacterium]|nr:Tripartite ATP-independent periplasmic transporter DctQ component [Deltaproteobacteria bacterium]